MAGRDVGPSGVLLLDKPASITSTRALATAKRLLGSRKGGHTGTLDPFATGLLPLAFGEATKFSRFLLDATKDYEATLQLGQTSTTGDVEGVISEKRTFNVDRTWIAEVLASFRGVQQQVPPMHSALHHEGRRLYELAREGIEVARAPRTIEIKQLDLVDIVGEKILISVKCTKGTYVRTLAEDIGSRLGCGAFLTALRRTKVGDLEIEQAVTLEALEAAGLEGARALLHPPQRFVAALGHVVLDPPRTAAFAQGRSVAEAGAEGEVAVFAEGGRFLGVGRRDGLGSLAAVRLMATPPTTDSHDFA